MVAPVVFNEIIAAVIALAAIAVIAYLAVTGSEQAAGALIAVLSAAVGYYLRGRVEKQTDPPPVRE